MKIKGGKIRVFLQYPWRFPDSPYYKYLLSSPPEGIEYLNVARQKGAITSAKKFWLLTRIKVNIRRILNWLNLPIVNSHLTPSSEEYNLIHCAHCLSKNTEEPWVADMEGVWSMFVSGFNNPIAIRRIKKTLLKKNCKMIIPWSEHAKRDILKLFPEASKKVELVYPAVPSQKKVSSERKDVVVFVARDFRLKGGVVALETMKKIKMRIPKVRCVVISPTSRALKEDYLGIEFYDLMPQKDLFKIMSQAKVFLYPSFMDTFGFTILEAMSFGVPVVALKTSLTDSVSEIIKEGEGFLIDSEMTHRNITKEGIDKISQKLVEPCVKLLKDASLQKKMSKNCLKAISSGRFSINNRNKKLKKIYVEALNENSSD
ncbi:MAG: glycosyltransferase family 4 protein [Candidatus Nanoarchaeia archaeon]